MAKPIAVGILLLTAASAGAAFAGNQQGPQGLQAYIDANIVAWNSGKDLNLGNYTQDFCAHQPQLCSRYGIGPILGKGGPTPAPEISPAGAGGALTILAACLAVLRGRRAARRSA